jgi:hypothetical protein
LPHIAALQRLIENDSKRGLEKEKGRRDGGEMRDPSGVGPHYVFVLLRIASKKKAMFFGLEPHSFHRKDIDKAWTILKGISFSSNP